MSSMAELGVERDREKDAIRKEIWALLERYEVVTSPRPCYGKIPGFVGSNNAAAKILKLEGFRRAETIYTTPDLSSRAIREESLKRGKKVIVSLPRLRGYVILDPSRIPSSKYGFASTLRGSLTLGERIRWPDNISVDLVVLGSVAVNRDGSRLGRGDGFYDLEYAILKELHVVDDKTPIVTAVHDLQITERKIPMYKHDVPVDYIITPTQLIVTSTTYPRPPGIIWDLLPIDFIKATPILRVLFGIS